MAIKEDLKQELKDERLQMEAVIAQLPQSLKSSIGNYDNKEELKRILLSQRESAVEVMERLRTHPDMRTVEYAQGTTIGATALASHDSLSNTITQYELLDKVGNVRETIIHEVHHKDFHQTKYEQLGMNLEQNSLISMHNEISAHLASLVQYRQDYKQAKTEEERQKVLKEIRATGHSFYADAIEKGDINPLSDKPDDFNKEMEFMFHGTQKMWMKDFAPRYDDQIHAVKLMHMDVHSYDDLQRNDANYNLARQNAYTIGGYDFSKFSDDASVKCTDEHTLWQDKAIAAGCARDYVKDPYQFPAIVVADKPMERQAELPEVRKDMSLEQQYQLQMYKSLMDNFKKVHAVALATVPEKDKEKVLKDMVKKDFSRNYHFKSQHQYQQITQFAEKLLLSGENPPANNAKFKEELDKICTINGVNVFKEIDKSRALENVQQDTDYSFPTMGSKFSMRKFLKNIDKQSEDSKQQILSDMKSIEGSFELRYKAYLAEEERQDKEMQRIRNQPFSDHLGTEEDRKPVKEMEWHYGAPKYEAGAKIRTRSDILDLTKPVLQDELTAREIKTAADRALLQLNVNQSADNVRASLKSKTPNGDEMVSEGTLQTKQKAPQNNVVIDTICKNKQNTL